MPSEQNKAPAGFLVSESLCIIQEPKENRGKKDWRLRKRPARSKLKGGLKTQQNQARASMEASSGSTGEDNQGARLCSEISWAANGGNGDATEQGTLL